MHLPKTGLARPVFCCFGVACPAAASWRGWRHPYARRRLGRVQPHTAARATAAPTARITTAMSTCSTTAPAITMLAALARRVIVCRAASTRPRRSSRLTCWTSVMLGMRNHMFATPVSNSNGAASHIDSARATAAKIEPEGRETGKQLHPARFGGASADGERADEQTDGDGSVEQGKARGSGAISLECETVPECERRAQSERGERPEREQVAKRLRAPYVAAPRRRHPRRSPLPGRCPPAGRARSRPTGGPAAASPSRRRATRTRSGACRRS